MGDPESHTCGRVCSRSTIVRVDQTRQERLRRRSGIEQSRLLTEPGRESRSPHLTGAGQRAAHPG